MDGMTDQRDLTAPLGLTMLSIGRWLREAKSYEITGAAILVSAAIIIGLSTWLLGVSMERSRFDTIYVGKIKYRMLGMALSQEGDKKIFMPVYEEVQR